MYQDLIHILVKTAATFNMYTGKNFIKPRKSVRFVILRPWLKINTILARFLQEPDRESISCKKYIKPRETFLSKNLLKTTNMGTGEFLVHFCFQKERQTITCENFLS